MASQFDKQFDFTPETKPQSDSIRSGTAIRTASRGSYRVTDDVIASLANAYENRRARQVTEWEKLGRQNLPSPV